MSVISTGKDGRIGFHGATKRFLSIEISFNANKFEANPSDTETERRGTGTKDTSIVIRGQDSTDADALTAADVAEMQLTETAPSSLEWTDTSATPASRLPASFFTMYPLALWRVDDVAIGQGGPGDVNEWSATLSPNNDD